MAFQDKNLTCQDCGNSFVFSAAEQEFYDQKKFENEPKRCPDCRRKKKEAFRFNRRGGGFDGGGQRAAFEITCSNCGKTDTVPFQPRGDRPVLCGDCFRKQREGQGNQKAA